MTDAAVTYTFVSGDLARSAEVNTNFNDILNHLNVDGVSKYKNLSIERINVSLTGFPGFRVSGGFSSSTGQFVGNGVFITITVDGDNANSMRVKFFAPWMQSTNPLSSVFVRLLDGATQIAYTQGTVADTANAYCPCFVEAIVPPFSGSKTFKAELGVNSGTPTVFASPTAPHYLEAVWV